MGFLKKLGKGIGKLASFAGKVVAGVAKGGIVGGVAAGFTNLGGSSSPAPAPAAAQEAAFKGNVYANSLPGGVTIGTDKELQQSKMIKYLLIALAFVAGIFLFKKMK